MSAGFAAASAEKQEHIAFLDGFRGFAALIVVVSHFANRTLLEVDAEALLAKSILSLTIADYQAMALGAMGNGAGQIGVMLFFPLSAFLMFHLYFEKAPTFHNLARFAVGRVARIFPLYYFALALCVATTLWLPFEFIEIEAEDYPAHLLFVQGNSVLWTIAPELVFYVVFACIWFAVPGRKTLLTLGCVMIIALSNHFAVVWKSHTIEFFLLGYLMYIYSRSDIRLGFQRMPGSVVAILFVSLLAFHLPAVYKVVVGASDPRMWQELHYAVAILLLFTMVFECRLLQVFFGSRGMRFLGKISFSIYLLHLFVMHALLHYDLIGPDLLSLAITVGLVLLLSSAVFFLYENPSRILIRARFSPGKLIQNAVATRASGLAPREL